mgnify:CR=1 FL=1
MRKQLFIRIIIVVLIAELLSVFSFAYLQYRLTTNEITSSLKSEMRYASSGYERQGVSFFTNDERKEYDRITIVEADGTVVYDSYFDSKKLANHRGRMEIEDALNKGLGHSERFSDDMMAETEYYAKK